MSTPRTRAVWLGGVITAAAIAMTPGAPMICGQTHHGAVHTTAMPASAAIVCPPPTVVAMSSSGDPGC
jgi:hypothetical protein